MIRVVTIAEHIEHGYRFSASCQERECEYFWDIDLKQMEAHYGGDQSLLTADILGKVGCPKCISTNLGFFHVPY